MIILTGTKKQINWAIEIREEKIAELENVLAGKPAYGYDENGCPKPSTFDYDIEAATKRMIKRGLNAASIVEAAVEEIRNISDSVWWIEHKNSHLGNIIATDLRKKYLGRRR